MQRTGPRAVGAGGTRRLRFSNTIANVGPGPVELQPRMHDCDGDGDPSNTARPSSASTATWMATASSGGTVEGAVTARVVGSSPATMRTAIGTSWISPMTGSWTPPRGRPSRSTTRWASATWTRSTHIRGYLGRRGGATTAPVAATASRGSRWAMRTSTSATLRISGIDVTGLSAGEYRLLTTADSGRSAARGERGGQRVSPRDPSERPLGSPAAEPC